MAGRRIRDLMRQARGDLHREMSVSALYIPAPNAAPVPCTVRVWRKIDNQMVGKLPGQQGAAVTSEPEDRLRFDLTQIPKLFRNAVVSVEPGEAYRIDHLYDVDLGYQTARVIPLNASEAAGLPLPDQYTPLAPSPAPSFNVSVPPGGNAGDVLRKRSETDFDMMWVAGGFTFTQTTPRMTWTIPHNFGRIPVIAVVGADGHEIDAEIVNSIPDYNSTTLNFLEPVAGAARLS